MTQLPWHIAVEIISICGFGLQFMGPPEKVAQYTDGTPSPVVRVVRHSQEQHLLRSLL